MTAVRWATAWGGAKNDILVAGGSWARRFVIHGHGLPFVPESKIVRDSVQGLRGGRVA